MIRLFFLLVRQTAFIMIPECLFKHTHTLFCAVESWLDRLYPYMFTSNTKYWRGYLFSLINLILILWCKIVMPKLAINDRNSVRLSKFSKITSLVNDGARIPILCFYEQYTSFRKYLILWGWKWGCMYSYRKISIKLGWRCLCAVSTKV